MNKKFLLILIKIAIVASFLTPLIVNGSFIFPFVFPKTMVFQVIVEIMFFAWLILMMQAPEYRPRRTKILWVLALFTFVIFLASVFGVNFQQSFWSSYERMTGLVTMLHYLAFFLVVTSILKTRKDWLLIFDAFIGSSIILAFIGLAQKFGMQAFVLAGQGRVSATFGNPAYYAAYILFALFFIAFMFFQRQGRWWRIYYAVAFLLNFLILYWTETRGALLAFGGAAILFLIALAVWPKSDGESEAMKIYRGRIKKIALAVLVFFMASSALIVLARNNQIIKNSPTLRRLTTISFQDATTKTRLLAWKISWQGFKEKPVLGWGWENFNVVFNKFYDPNLYPVESWFDRAHNIVFDTLISSGVLGFISFFGIFAVVMWALYKAYKQRRIDFLNASLFAILPLAYLAQDFFVFDMLFSYLPLFLFLAFIGWIDKGKEAATDRKITQEKGMEPNMFLKIAALVVLLIMIYGINIRPALAGSAGIRAIASANVSGDELVKNFRNALDYGTFGRFEVRLQLFDMAKNALNSYQSAGNKKPIEDLANFAIEEGEKNMVERPLDARYNLEIGQLNMLASQYDPSHLVRAEQILQKTLALSPNRQITLFSLGETELRLGKKDEGINDFKKAVALNDQVAESHWNLVLVYFSVGDKEDAQKEIALMKEKFGELSADQYSRIADILSSGNDVQDALIYAQKAVQLQPNNPNVYGSLANVYLAMGDKVKAKDAALKVEELNPSMKQQVDAFIKNLGI